MTTLQSLHRVGISVWAMDRSITPWEGMLGTAARVGSRPNYSRSSCAPRLARAPRVSKQIAAQLLAWDLALAQEPGDVLFGCTRCWLPRLEEGLIESLTERLRAVASA